MEPELKGDLPNLVLLFTVYVIQGIAWGLTTSIPMMLQSVTYSQQAIFSLVCWPFSFKLLWAPLVDSIYIPWIGRRKSWLIPSEYFIGIFLLWLAHNEAFLFGLDGGDPQVNILTAGFFVFNFLVATHDTVVDGWTLTLLKRVNLVYASTCNSVGQIVGFVIGHALLLSVTSAEFCNAYFRTSPQDTGIVSFKDYLIVLGSIHLAITTTILLFKREKDAEAATGGKSLGIKETYRKIYELVRLPSVRLLSIVLLTYKVGFATTESVFKLKLMEAGTKGQTLALLTLPVMPIEILTALITSRYTKNKPLDVVLTLHPFRLLLGPIFGLLLFWRVQCGENIPSSYFLFFFLAYAVHQMLVYAMAGATSAFNGSVSDPAIGATYITLLNTAANLGSRWPPTLALGALDFTTVKLFCKTVLSYSYCGLVIDGFYVETAICLIVGFTWIWWGKEKLKKLQGLPQSEWKCS